MVTQKMPRLYLKRTVAELEVGEEGWIPRQAVWVNLDAEVFIYKGQVTTYKAEQTTDIKVIHEEKGYVLDFKLVQTVIVWERQDILENRMGDALPVVELRFNTGVPQ